MKNIKDIKDIRYNISLYILLPIIFAGIALLTLVASYNLTIYYQKAVGDPVWHVALWGVFLVLFSVISGVLIVRFIIDPMERFIKKTDTLGVVSAAGTEDKHAKKDEMTRYIRMFDRVTDFLSRVEARELFPRIVGQSKTMQLLTAYDWPGNVRELKNAVESACVMAKDVIEPAHLPSSITEPWGSPSDEKLDFDENRNLDDRINEFERGMITEALIRAGGVQVTAARLLGVSERSLWHRVKKFDIDVDQYKRSGS